MQLAVEFMAGLVLTALGVSYLLRMQDWIDWLGNLQLKGRRGSLTLGLVLVIGGSFVLAFHPVWQGMPLVLTLLGLFAFIKGTMILLFPGWIPGQLERLYPHFKAVVKVKAAFTLAVGLLMLWDVYQSWQRVPLS